MFRKIIKVVAVRKTIQYWTSNFLKILQIILRKNFSYKAVKITFNKKRNWITYILFLVKKNLNLINLGSLYHHNINDCRDSKKNYKGCPKQPST